MGSTILFWLAKLGKSVFVSPFFPKGLTGLQWALSFGKAVGWGSPFWTWLNEVWTLSGVLCSVVTVWEIPERDKAKECPYNSITEFRPFGITAICFRSEKYLWYTRTFFFIINSKFWVFFKFYFIFKFNNTVLVLPHMRTFIHISWRNCCFYWMLQWTCEDNQWRI